MKRHQPVHLYLDNQIYFVTAHTYGSGHYLWTVFHKAKLLQKINELMDTFHYQLFAWVILANHYHILFKTKLAKDLPKLFGKLHSGVSYEMNREEGKPGRKIWQNYWDWCIRSEKDYWTHFNYLHHNPIKHGAVTRMEDYEFSSFNYWVNRKGFDWVMSVFEQHPILDFSVDHDDY